MPIKAEAFDPQRKLCGIKLPLNDDKKGRTPELPRRSMPSTRVVMKVRYVPAYARGLAETDS